MLLEQKIKTQNKIQKLAKKYEKAFQIIDDLYIIKIKQVNNTSAHVQI